MESFATETGEYTIESLSPGTFQGALNVIREAFCQDESVSRGCGVDQNPAAAAELLELCADAALDGVSLVALRTCNRAVVAVAFNKIQVQEPAPAQRSFFESFAAERCREEAARSLVRFMAEVDSRCDLFRKYGVDCSLEIMFLATLREHRRRGLAMQLCRSSLVVAKRARVGPVAPLAVADLGPRYCALQPREPIATYPKICQAIWTSAGSQKVGRALRFDVHLTVPLSEFACGGQTYAQRIGDASAFCEVAAIAL